MKTAIQIVSFGGASARISQRGDGNFTVRWREAKKGRSTTSTSREGAVELARKKVRELAGQQGSRLVSVIEAEAIEGLKQVVGNRSLSGVVEQLGDMVRRAGGWEHLGRAVEAYLKAGHGQVLRVPVGVAVSRFLESQAGSAVLYRRGLKKELEAFVRVYADVSVCDVSEGLLKPWISRVNEDGGEPGARYFNNRLATWKTFMNRCREWGMLAKGEDHAGEVLKPRKMADWVPEIWTVPEVEKILSLVRDELPECLNFLVIGCWLGLRPFEMHRLKWDAWDWERGYVDVGADVALKTMQQRFVPIPDNVRAMLYGRHEDARWGRRYKRRAKTCTRSDDQVFLSELLRERGVIKTWPQDVMRHSYISYRLAQGHGRGQVAEWAGNSEAVIRQRYRRPLRAEDGAAWFRVGIPDNQTIRQ
jgi:integrase